jgi:hypothetical protein
MGETATIDRIQDSWSKLVEECRIGSVLRPVALPGAKRTSYLPHQSQIDLAEVPVFFWGEQPTRISNAAQNEAMDAAIDGTFKLPYQRVAFLYYISERHSAHGLAPERHRLDDERVYAVVAEEETDGSLTICCFVWHWRTQEHWIKQAWQGHVPIGTDGADVVIAFDPAFYDNADGEFLEFYTRASEHRVIQFLIDCHKLMTKGGSVTLAAPGYRTEKINNRRGALKLPLVPPIRIIKFDNPVVVHDAPSEPSTAKRPHFRRGTYRTLATGRRVWVKPSAIHGGSGAAPPWYEIRA